MTARNIPDTREIRPLKYGWKFSRGDFRGAELPVFDDDGWDIVRVPHDWAITGPFSPENDVQYTAISADGEKKERSHVGRTGGLPHVGKAWYRITVPLSEEDVSRRVWIEFDGVMSRSVVYCNGTKIGSWPYGYASFAFDLSDHVTAGENCIAVSVDNRPFASRWYPGAGIFRNVRLVTASNVHVARWGTYITTPDIGDAAARVTVRTSIENHSGEGCEVELETLITDHKGTPLSAVHASRQIVTDGKYIQDLVVDEPIVWSPETPVLYKAVSIVRCAGRIVDRYETPFGFRTLKFDSDDGFSINGRSMKMNGVCMHHDLGPIGAAVNRDAIARQLAILKEMGCNAIRTSHNPPAPELLELCDRMGFLVIDEAFDEWRIPKVENGYHILFDKWAERDLRAMIRRDRNHPSVIMWSIGNEILEQGDPDGIETAMFLHDVCMEEDPSRPTTAGFNNPDGAIKNGLAATVDVPGWNYRPHRYQEFKHDHPAWPMYGSETESCVSTRGEYRFPPQEERNIVHDNLQVSSFDLAAPPWGYPPDIEFQAQDACAFIMGEFVWTGFDYLGEPTPYKLEWPSRSSYFGIVDLCGIPKDRYYLYQSKWTEKPVLRVLPHWTWPDRKGEPTSIFVYTNFDSVELFLNGRSLGRRRKYPNCLFERYRLAWTRVPYEPGELKAIGYDADGNAAAETIHRTADTPTRLEIVSDREEMRGDGDTMSFLHIKALDREGTICPHCDTEVSVEIDGPAELAGIGSGDPTSLEPFQEPKRKLFHGEMVAYIRSIPDGDGTVTVKVVGEGLEPATVTIRCTPNTQE